MVSLLSSIALCFSAFSFAWINWNVDLNSNSIKLTSGESVLYVDFYGYKESKTFPLFPDNTTSSDTSVQQNPIKTYITSTGEAQGNQGQYEVSAAFSFDSVSLLDVYVGEHTFNYDLFPKVYLEFQYLKDVFDGYIKASIKVDTADASNVLEFYYVTKSNDGNYEHILREGEDYSFKKADSISSGIDLFGAPTDIDSKDGYTIDHQLKVPEYNNHNDAGKLLYSKATLIMIKFNSKNFKEFVKTSDTETLSNTFNSIIQTLINAFGCLLILIYIFFNSVVVGMEIVIFLIVIFAITKIFNPEHIIFVCGPTNPYYRVVTKYLKEINSGLVYDYPTPDKLVINDDRVIWTYHPAYQNRIHKKDEVLIKVRSLVNNE